MLKSCLFLTSERMREVFPTPLSPTNNILTSLRGFLIFISEKYTNIIFFSVTQISVLQENGFDTLPRIFHKTCLSKSIHVDSGIPELCF